MIGCILLGGLAAMGMAAFARRCHMGWSHGHSHFRHHHRHQGFGCGFGAGDGPGDFFDSPGMGFGGPPLRSRNRAWFVLRQWLRRVETTPTQERAIQSAVAEFREAMKPLRAEARQTRADIAAAMRRTSVDEVILGEMFARHDRVSEDLRKAFVGLLARIHDALDDIQRERFAGLIEKGSRGWRFGDGDPFADGP